MFHSTTILAVRHRDRAVLAGDGQVTLRPDRRQAGRAEDPAPLQRPHPGRLCRLGRRLLRAVLALRSRSSSSTAATSSARPSSSRRTGARDRILRRLEAMLIVLDKTVDVPAVRHRRSHRARRWHRGDRIGRTVRAGGREGAGEQHRARRARDRRKGDGDRRRDLHLHQREHRRRRAVECAILPSRNDADVRRLADAAADRRRARQVRRRPGGGQARGGDRAAQPHAPPEAARPSWPRRSRRRTS